MGNFFDGSSPPGGQSRGEHCCCFRCRLCCYFCCCLCRYFCCCPFCLPSTGHGSLGCARQSSLGCARSIVEIQTQLRCVRGVVSDPHARHQSRTYTLTPLLLFLLLLSDSNVSAIMRWPHEGPQSTAHCPQLASHSNKKEKTPGTSTMVDPLVNLQYGPDLQSLRRGHGHK